MMKTMNSYLKKAALFLAPVIAACSLGHAQNQPGLDPIEISPLDPPCPNLLARDIEEPTDSHLVRLVFPTWPVIDVASLSDGDLTATGPNGEPIRGQLIDFVHEEIPFPQTLSALPREAGDIILLPQAAPLLVATYQFDGPGDNAWDAADNGIYRVALAENEILTVEGRPLPHKTLGGFRCVIEDTPGDLIQPHSVDINFRRLAGNDATSPLEQVTQYFAEVTMTFSTPHVRIAWSEAQPTGTGFLAPITAVKLPLPEPLPVPLPSADEVASSNRNGTDATNADQLRVLPTFTHTYRLGALNPGTYPFNVVVNDIREGQKDLVIPSDPPVDTDPPEASLAVRNITQPKDTPHLLVVTYKDAHAIDLTTLGDGDLAVLNPCVFLHETGVPADPALCNWQAQRARLLEVVPLADDSTKLKAVYEIEPPRNGWTKAHNGFYPVVWLGGEVCDRIGNCNTRQRLGGFEVAIDDSEPPIPATAEIRVDSSDPLNVAAKVHVKFGGYYAVTSQEIRRDGNRIYLVATAHETPVIAIFPPPPHPQEDLFFDVGPLRQGDYLAAFIMNGHLYDREEFSVAPSPPIEADVDLVVDSSDPTAVSATVTVQFRTPHRLVAGEVRREGHRLILPAKAEPLPVPFDAPVNPPVPAPITLTYEIGALPPGGYLAAFVMNDFPYAAEDFLINDPGPPIAAKATIEVEENDAGEAIATVAIRFETPHLITARDLHRRGNHFILEATAHPAPVLITDALVASPFPTTVILRYPLGELDPGQFGATFVMNGYPYARTTWEKPDPHFRAEVSLDVVQSDAGIWVAKAKIKFANPQVRITDPGTLVQNGSIFMINASAELTIAADVAPEFYEFDYELGDLDPGPYWLKFFINGHVEKQRDFYVQPIPARVDLAVHAAEQPVTATATIQFRDHYRITDQNVIRFGRYLIMTAEAEGPLPILAPLPPAPIVLDYTLGELEKGSYLAVFVINGHPYEVTPFRVHQGPFEARVDLAVDVSPDGTTLKATVEIDDPYVIVTNPGQPVIEGNRIKINATAERVTFITEPSGDPQCLDYDLGQLPPGTYHLSYCLNEKPEAETRFHVPVICDPLPHVVNIRILEAPIESTNEIAHWLSKVTLALLPGQHVTDWGVVRRDGEVFHVNITVECRPYPTDPIPVDPVLHDDPDLLGVINAADGIPHIGGAPVRLVSHTYRLGPLGEGHYGFCLHSRGQTLACERFLVGGAPPRVELSVGNITEEQPEHRFGISFSDPSGLDHDAIQSAKVWITGPDHYREEATLQSYASTDDVPSTGASARYAVHGPEGSWDRPDNGRYRVFIEAEKVRDLDGNALTEPLLGHFKVNIAPPPPAPGVNVSLAMSATGDWEATVEIISAPGQQVVVDSWGPLVSHGQTFVVLADVHREPTNGPVEPLSHTYNLGQLLPGDYLFVWKSDEADCGLGNFTVPGVEPPAIDRFLANNRLPAGSIQNGTARYFFGLNQHRTQPEMRAEVIRDEQGGRHLGIRYRRLTGADVEQQIQASNDLTDWQNVSDQVDIVERTLDVDGTEEVLVCLRSKIGEGPFRYLRIHLTPVE
ncbi:MAG: hypothetical protein ACSHYF_18110 [Verrucomicrobiaceae bacterium]